MRPQLALGWWCFIAEVETLTKILHKTFINSLFPARSSQKANCPYPRTYLVFPIGNIICFQNQHVQFQPCFLLNPFLPTAGPISVQVNVILPVAQVKNLEFFFLDSSLPLKSPHTIHHQNVPAPFSENIQNLISATATCRFAEKASAQAVVCS